MPALKILFVDDDLDESYLFNEALEYCKIDFEMVKAYDGNHLISYLHNNDFPDVVIIDINMPNKDGLEALAEVRSHEKFKDLPLIMYSTNKNEESINNCYERGANMFVVKPADFDGMVQVVNRIISIDWKKPPKMSREEFVVTA